MRFQDSARSLALLLGLLWLASSYAGPGAELSSPAAGWRYSGLLDDLDSPRVAYPTPPIDRGGQRGRSLIEGDLKNLAGTDRAQRLVVNGNPLPLYTDAQGHFVRPYAFGAGSNSVEVASADGQSLKRVQFYEANAGRVPPRVRVALGWDDPKAELECLRERVAELRAALQRLQREMDSLKGRQENRLDHAVEETFMAQVDRHQLALDVDSRRQDLAAKLLLLDGDRDDLRTLQQLAREFIPYPAVRRGFNRERGDLRRLPALVEPVGAVGPGKHRVSQHHGDNRSND